MRFGLRDWAGRDPDRPAVVTGGATTSYGELEAAANRAARLFRAAGLRPGDHVAVVLGNDPAIFALVWGAYRAGLYLTPVPSGASLADAAYVIRDSTAKLVVLDARLPISAGLRGAAPDTGRWFSLAGPIEGCEPLEDALAAQSASPCADEQPGALMMYTSGTTGAPKGVWRPLPADGSGPPPFAGDLLSIFAIEASSRYLSTQPLYHAAALRFGLAFTAAGGTVHVMPRFDAGAALDLLERERITHSQWVPTMFRRLLALPEARRAAHRAPAHRCALHGAAPCPIDLKRAMIRWWGPIVQDYYSGSEGVGLSTITSAEWLERPGSVGRCVKGELHVLGDDDRELPAGEIGRLYFSGVAPFAYFDAPEKTAERRSRQGYQTFGDVGFRDADGYIFLTDRQDDLIISGGVNIYPQEVERALSAHVDVEDCAVVGLPDDDLGERAVAFVVLKPTAPPEPGVRLALDAHALAALGRVKRPRELRFVEDLPRSPTGKLLRRELAGSPPGHGTARHAG